MKKMWIVGAGYMGSEYAKVLTGLGIDFVTIGRGEKSVAAFQKETNLPVKTGGLVKYAENNPIPEYAIIASSIEELTPLALFLMEKGTKHILIEKPSGVSQAEMATLAKTARTHNAYVQVAYNRRFYSSTLEAERIIAEDGGVTSFNFEFTEWSHQIETFDLSKTGLNIWFLANSTHVVDLAFYLGGHPKEMCSFTSGSLDWYKPASAFSGAGISDKGALFSYQANWKAPGRWGVEILTTKHRLIFRPMEQLHIQKIGSVAIEKVDVEDSLDKEYKPGLYLQTKSFLSDVHEQNAIDIHEHLENMKYYDRIERGIRS